MSTTRQQRHGDLGIVSLEEVRDIEEVHEGTRQEEGLETASSRPAFRDCQNSLGGKIPFLGIFNPSGRPDRT